MAYNQIKRHHASHKPKRPPDNQRQMVKSNASIPQIDLVDCSLSACLVLSTSHFPPNHRGGHALDSSSSVVLQTGQPMMSLANRVCLFRFLLVSFVSLSWSRLAVSRPLGGPANRKRWLYQISLVTHRHWVRPNLLLFSLLCLLLLFSAVLCLLCVFCVSACCSEEGRKLKSQSRAYSDRRQHQQ